MDSLLSDQSWFAAKAAIALSPMLIFMTADVIEWFLHRMFSRRPEVAPKPGCEPHAITRQQLPSHQGEAPDRLLTGRVLDGRGQC
jgi:hypothetical protein